MIYHIMHQQAPWDNVDSVSYLSAQVKQDYAWLVPGWESALGFISVSTLTHAFGFDSLRTEWNAPVFLSL
jgi:hypothetical protein